MSDTPLKQHTSSSAMLGDHFELIPPLSEDFSVYGTPDVVERARRWALDGGYLLFNGNADKCAHGLYRMHQCPTSAACHDVGFDHTQIWVNRDGKGAFLLTQPYVDEIPDDLLVYARMHGLIIASYPSDGWYGSGTLPIRLSIPNDWPLWPIERDVVVVLHTQPVRWPED